MILLVNGPNLNLLGEGPGEAGETLAEVERRVAEACAAYGVEVRALQSNSEGALLDFLQRHRAEAQGVIVNPGPLAHSSHALRDLLRLMPCPAIEVQLDNPAARPAPPRRSVVAAASVGHIAGLGTAGYRFAAVHLCELLEARAAAEGAAERDVPDRRPDEGAGPCAASARASGRGAVEAPPGPHHGASQPRATEALGAVSRCDATPSPSGPNGDAVPAEGTLLPMDVDARGEYEPF